ncbi:MAG: HAD-IA family hydrolase, partial [Acidimicrobiales bacterium]
RAAWKRAFDDFLVRHVGADVDLFDAVADYLEYVDGKPRYDGVRSFLASRGISIAEGTPADPPSVDTVCGMGNRKNAEFLAHMATYGARSYPATLRLIDELRQVGLRIGLITSSRNASVVLEAAGVGDIFDVTIDGEVAAERGLPGKPSPAVFLTAAGDLGVDPPRAVVVEDAIAGVAAGRAGGFGLVMGVARHGNTVELLTAGADLAVVSVTGRGPR